MATEQYHAPKLPERAQDARDLLEVLKRLEAKIEAAIADTRARRMALSAPSRTEKRS